jgi:hypothetical protein
LAQGTVCKILADHAVKPHKVRYYLERRDPQFEPKMAEILCVYRQIAVLREHGQNAASGWTGALKLRLGWLAAFVARCCRVRRMRFRVRRGAPLY